LEGALMNVNKLTWWGAIIWIAILVFIFFEVFFHTRGTDNYIATVSDKKIFYTYIKAQPVTNYQLEFQINDNTQGYLVSKEFYDKAAVGQSYKLKVDHNGLLGAYDQVVEMETLE